MSETRTRGIQCGNCKTKHATVAEVRECYEIGEAREPATPPQISYAQMLFRTRQPRKAEQRDDAEMVEGAINKMSKTEISEFISAYKQQPMRPKEALKMQSAEEIEDGIYYNPETKEFIKVYWNLGKSRLLAKRLVLPVQIPSENGYGEAKPTWEYIGVANSRILSGFRRMNQEEAAEFGQMYGVCIICGRDLNDELSVARGVGRICWEKQGW